MGIFLIIIAFLIWGAAPPVFKWALQDIPPFTLAFIRFAGAGILFLPFLFRQKIHILTRKDWKHILLGGLWGVAINVGALFVGLEFAPSINVHVINSTSPLLLYLLSILILKERPHSHVVRGMILAFCGVLVIILGPILFDPSQKLGISNTTSEVLLGNALFIVAIVGGVLITVHTKLVSRSVSALFITAVQFISGSIVFIPFMLIELQTFELTHLTARSWIGIIYGMLFSSAIAYACMNIGLRTVSAQQIGILTYLMPIISIVVAVPLLGEIPGLFFIIGTGFITCGILIGEHHKRYKIR